jgi:uroporphyrinogen decarboxylase
MEFQPDYRHMLEVLANRRPVRLPVYEHIVNIPVMEKILGVNFSPLYNGDECDRDEFFRQYCRFWREMTYDTVSFEVCITEILPGPGALKGGKGPIQTRADFERYPWHELESRYWRLAEPKFNALRKNLPSGMTALGGVGNGVFEISEDLVGFEYLAYMQADDPKLFSWLYVKIGDLMVTIWQRFLTQFGDLFAICRMGDDLGYKTRTLTSPRNIRQFIIPQYQRVISLIRQSGHPFLWHSCGNIFAVMDEVIALGIGAKHSNEDVIAPFETWIDRYGDRIGLLGGIDVDILCRSAPAEIVDLVYTRGRIYRARAKGYALGSGNSIPDYVPVEGYLSMLEAAQKIRANEAQGNI